MHVFLFGEGPAPPPPGHTGSLVCPSAGHAALVRRQRGQTPPGLKRPGRDPTRWFLAPATPENVQSSSVTNTLAYPAGQLGRLPSTPKFNDADDGGDDVVVMVIVIEFIVFVVLVVVVMSCSS